MRFEYIRKKERRIAGLEIKRKKQGNKGQQRQGIKGQQRLECYWVVSVKSFLFFTVSTRTYIFIHIAYTYVNIHVHPSK